jgi:DNA-formamidopyrimidine glycosylase
MPEGVEVKLSADLIKPLVKDKQVKYLETYPTSRYASSDPEGYPEFQNELNKPSCIVLDVQTKGKFMYWIFSNNQYLMCTFGMTGQWSSQIGKHPCFSFDFTDGTKIYFNDPRHFGTIKFVNSYALLNLKLSELGWDPLQHDLAGTNPNYFEYIVGQLVRSTKPIGQVLLDQSLFAGVGNYIRAEALYLAKISPFRQSNLLKKDEVKILCEAIVKVMTDSYKQQGATILTYKDAYGAEGKYSGFFQVYGKKKDPFGNSIVKHNTPEGRAIHWCPAIQV